MEGGADGERLRIYGQYFNFNLHVPFEGALMSYKSLHFLNN
jgi:hypothetical protein